MWGYGADLHAVMMRHLIITVSWPGDVVSWRSCWFVLVWLCVGCVRLMVVERGGCWQRAVVGVVDGSGWWWLEDEGCLLLIMPISNISVCQCSHGQVMTAISEVCVDSLNRCMVQLEECTDVYSGHVSQM